MKVDPAPLFIVGMPRSGTKLVRDLLNRHPRVAIPEIETEFLPWLEHRIERDGAAETAAAFSRLYRSLLRLNYFDFRRQQGPVIGEKAWRAACRSFDAAGIFEALVRHDACAPVGSGIVWGDKSPSYIDDIELIERIFPGARVLHVVRDVRDYCLSIHRAWGKHMLRAAERWADGVTGARQAGRALGERFLEIRYEDLLADPTGAMRRVCNFLDLDFDPAMVTLAKPSENLGAARGAARVVSDNSGKFVHAMEPAVMRDIEAIAGPVLQDLGYPLVHPPQVGRRLGRLQRIGAQWMDAIHLIRSDTEQLGVARTVWFHLRYFLTTRG